MTKPFKRIASLLLCLLFLCPLFSVSAAENYVTQTSMVRALQSFLQTTAPLGSEYTAASEFGGGTGNLGFAQTLFYRLFLTQLSADAHLEKSEALTLISSFAAGDAAQAATLSTAMGALRFGDVIQYGSGGHIALVLGENASRIVVYDCGFGGDLTVRMRLVDKAELEAQALRQGNEGGLSFYRAKSVPTFDITLNLVSKPSVTSYYLEATPSLDGLSLEYYSAQTGKVAVASDDPQLKSFSSTREAGNVPMIFFYGSAFAFCTLEVKNETVESIDITKKPTRLEYTTEDTLDMTGAEVTAKMKDGTSLVLTESEYTLTYVFTTPGSAVVTVSYGGKTDTFNVTVKEPPVVKLSVVAPTKTQYYVGERLDLSGASIVVDYEKNKNVTLPLLDSMLSVYDTSLPGEVEITVSYGGKSAAFSIQVVENKVASLHLKSSLSKQYRKGASLDLAAIELSVFYEDGQSRTITARDCVVTINGREGSTFDKSGEAEIVFTYQNVSTGITAVQIAEDPMEKFITTIILVLALLIGLPLLALFVIFLIRRVRAAKQQNASAPAGVSYEEGDGVRIFRADQEEEESTVVLPRIPTGTASDKRADDNPTIQIPVIPASKENLSADSPTIQFQPISEDSDPASTGRKIDFFDDL